MPRTLSSSRWMKSPPHTFGLVVAALVLAAPLVRAEEAPSVDVDRRVHLLEGRIHSEATPDASGKTLEFKQNAEKCLQHGVPLLGLVSFGYLF